MTKSAQVFVVLLGVATASVAAAQDPGNVDYVEECPVENGFFADAVQCDRYYECKDGVIIDQTCPDGLVFDESSNQFAKCSFPFSIDCTDRQLLQTPKSTPRCPRQNGYFPDPDPKVCDRFYFCVDGVANAITCPASLVFDPNRGQCAFGDQVKRKGCSSEDLYNFKCPPKDPGNRHEHPRFPDPTDCQFFYICIDSLDARRNGCTVGLVFNEETLACDRPENVAGECRTWYNETYLESVGGIPPLRPPGSAGGVPLDQVPGRRVPVPRKRPQPPPNIQQGGFSNLRTPNLPGDGNLVSLRPAAASASQAAGTRANRVRTRVRGQATQPPLVVEEEGPPSFALTTDEDIQRFRESLSSRFEPSRTSSNGGNRGSGGGGSRLQVVSRRPSPSQRDPPRGAAESASPPFTAFNRRPPPSERDPPRGTAEPASPPFTAFSAVPNARRRPAAASLSFQDEDDNEEENIQVPPSNFGSRGNALRSRQRTRTEQTSAAPPADDGPVSFHEDPFQTNFGEAQRVREDPREGVAVRTSSSTRTSFSTSSAASSPQSSASPGRGRLEVQSIRVRPNVELARQEDAAVDEADAATNAGFGGRRDPVRAGVIRNRNRVRQRRPLRQRGNEEQNY